MVAMVTSEGTLNKIRHDPLFALSSEPARRPSIVDVVRAYVEGRGSPTSSSDDVGVPVEEWDEDRYTYRGSIREGTQAEVDIFVDMTTNKSLAVKRVWQDDLVSEDGQIDSPKVETKLNELSLIQMVQDAGVCSLNQLFRNDAGELLLVSEWMPERDLFSFSLSLGQPGPEREEKVLQMLPSLLDAVERLHKRCIAHGNLCVENAMVHESPDQDNRPVVLLSDFTFSKQDSCALSAQGPTGKAMYVAPEALTGEPYDARSADLFACGVIAYSMAIGSYPWVSTVPKKDKAFTYYCDNGLEMYLAKRMCCEGNNRVTVGQCMSPRFTQLLSLLWSKNPEERIKAVAVAQREP